MPEDISNSSSRILISNIKTTFVTTYAHGASANAPIVRFEFSISPNKGVIDFGGMIGIKSFKYCLIPRNENNEYRDVNESDVWQEFTKEQINNFIASTNGQTPTFGIAWNATTNVNNRRYLFGTNNALETSEPIPYKNYISFNVKRVQEFLGIVDSQLHVKMSFEEIREVSNNQYAPVYDGINTVFDADGNSEIYFKTMNYQGQEPTNIGIKTTNPEVGELVEEKTYTNSSSFSIKVSGYTGDVTHYAYEINKGGLKEWVQVPEAVNGVRELTINLGSDTPDGKYSIVIIARDQYFNTTDAENAILIEITKASTEPFDCEINIYGQDGNSRYAGIRINPDGSFSPDRSVSIVFFGNSELPMTCRIYSSNSDVLIPQISSVAGEGGSVVITKTNIPNGLKELSELDWSNSSSNSSPHPNCDTGEFLYKNTYIQDKDRAINEIQCVLVGEDYNVSSERAITIVFKDIAGNQWSETKRIVLNNRIFTCEKKNLREPSSDYSHIVMKQNTYGAFDTIPEAASGQEDAYKRMWNDIYFPDKQGPKMKGNDIDLDWCRMAYKQYVQNSNKFVYDDVDNYGIINMSLDSEKEYQPVLDSEGRTTSIWNTSKKYNSYVSRNRSDIWFRVIDNTGYGDITLEFERFDMMSNPGDMVNPTAGGYKGDVVMIYRADDSRCLQEVKNADGSITYPVEGLNTVYMELLAVYSGRPGSVYDWFSGESIRSNDTTGSFEVTFNCSKICIIVCTDSSKEASGFKIKAGKKIGLTYSNYDMDETNGELWYHGESDGWGSTDKKIRMFYDYYDSNVSYDYDRGFVIMNVNDMPKDAIVTCDYSYYKNKEDYNEEENSWLNGNVDDNSSIEHYRLYLASDDDFYEYIVPSVYVTPFGAKIDKSGPVYTPSNKVAGKFTDSFWAIDKDRGVIEINKYSDNDPSGNVPFNDSGYPMRITMDYTHHTFYRLSNDGYGNVHFEDKVIVADSTPVYPDATWADIRIVNEGESILENGKFIFKCRGEVEGDSEEVKKPLDVNRPWDVQEGKKAVTWDRCRVYLSYTYDENYFQFTPSISDLRRTYNKAGGNNATLKKSDSEPYLAPKESVYGRIIWNLAGDTGSGLNNAQYPNDGLTVGRKSWSAEVSGRFYVVED